MGVLARTKVVLVKKIKQKLLVSMICKCRRILCCFFHFVFLILFLLFFFYLPTKPEKNRQKNLSLPKKKSCLSCDLMSSTSLSCSVFFSLGMLWWTAVNLYSSCKLIVRKLYRFLYFGRKKFFFSVIKDFLSWHHILLPPWAVSSFARCRGSQFSMNESRWVLIGQK